MRKRETQLNVSKQDLRLTTVQPGGEAGHDHGGALLRVGGWFAFLMFVVGGSLARTL